MIAISLSETAQLIWSESVGDLTQLVSKWLYSGYTSGRLSFSS